MSWTKVVCLVVAGALISTSQILAQCSSQDLEKLELDKQKKDIATVQRLEHAWSVAYLRGNTAFERCLLAPDFMEILSDGAIKHLNDELALAKNNEGNNLPLSGLPAVTVHLRGNVAAAYGVSESKTANGSTRRKHFVDYYVWEKTAWRVFFAQQTPISD